MRWFRTLLVLSVVFVLLGTECTQPAFPVIECEMDEDCLDPCTDECEAIDQLLMSAVCDANGFCECLCMQGSGTGGMSGAGGG